MGSGVAGLATGAARNVNFTTETGGDKLHSPTHNGKKPGLMDKLKGEVKVISGKLGNNQEKVMEGKK